MRVSANQQNLAKGLSIVSRAVSSRTTMPVLSNILIEAKGSQIRLAATNREIGITCWIGAKVEEEGAITIPARLLSEFVNSLPPERVDMELNDRAQTLHLACARNTANIKGIGAYEFPLLPSTRKDDDDEQKTAIAIVATPITIDANDLRTMIDQVVFAASADENRPTLTGVEVKIADVVSMAATDGFRLSVRRVSLDGAIADPVSAIIPARSLGEVAKMAADADSTMPVQVYVSGNKALFAMVGKESQSGAWLRAELVSELIDAKFPDYRGTMPKSWETRCTVDTAQLLKAVRVAQLFARDNANIVRVSAIPTKEDRPDQLRISANSAEMGDNVSDVDAVIEGPAVEITFNAKYLIDMLDKGNLGERVVVELTQPTRPGKFYAVGKEEEFVHVIMPMQRPNQP